MYIIDRSAAGYRIFNNTQPNIGRFRNRSSICFDFTKQMKFTAFDKFFFNVKGTTTAHFFDHNRVGLNLKCKVLYGLKLDIGYINITHLPVTSNVKLHEKDIFLNLTYQIHKRIMPKKFTLIVSKPTFLQS